MPSHVRAQKFRNLLTYKGEKVYRLIFIKTGEPKVNRHAEKLRNFAENWLGMFFTPLRASHYLELVNPLWNSQRLQARVEGVWDETADCRTLILRPGKGWRRHRAGQHVRVGVMIDGMRHTRTYSISSAPERDDGCISITIKIVPGGRVSQALTRQLRTGMYLPIGLPQGDFFIPDAVPVRALFITAGSGITPIMSMLRSLSSSGHLPDIHHIHFAPHAFAVIFGRELRQMAVNHPRYQLSLVYTRESNAQSSSAPRHFTPTLLAKLCPDWRERDLWLCGPQSLVESVKSTWQEAGLASRVHLEQFHATRASLAPDAGGGGNVAFVRSGSVVNATAQQNLLRLAEDAGLNPEHGCRMGICHGCSVKLLSGQLRDLRNGQIISCDPGQEVQICVTAAVGDIELDL